MAVSFKKDQRAALYFTMSDIVHYSNVNFVYSDFDGRHACYQKKLLKSRQKLARIVLVICHLSSNKNMFIVIM